MCIAMHCDTMSAVSRNPLLAHVLTTYKCSTSTADPSGRATGQWKMVLNGCTKAALCLHGMDLVSLTTQVCYVHQAG